jgi:hypothetical protein
MCTVTLRLQNGGLLLTINRDEANDRGAEEAPRAYTDHAVGITFAAPIDTQAGGTWVAVNDHGVVGCLLNGYVLGDFQGLETALVKPSRGLIVPKALMGGSLAGVYQWLDTVFDPSSYPSFSAIFADPTGGRLYSWRRGANLTHTPLNFDGGWFQLSSSGWNIDDVLAYRAKAFAEWRQAGASFAGALPAYHLDVKPGDEELAPRTTRPWSHTQSITQVEAQPQPKPHAVVRWWPVAAGERPAEAPAKVVTLPLRAWPVQG